MKSRSAIVHGGQHFNLNDQRVLNSLAYISQQVNSLNIGKDEKSQINIDYIVKNKYYLKTHKQFFFVCVKF